MKSINLYQVQIRAERGEPNHGIAGDDFGYFA